MTETKHTQFEDSMEKAFEEVISSDKKSDIGKGEYSLTDLEKEIIDVLNTLPKLDRYALRREMVNMIVSVEENPTTFGINEGLAKAQAYKSRLAEIYTLAIREFKLRKRCMEILQDAIMKVSNEKSADKRKGEFAMRYPILLMQEQAAENFYEEVKHLISNMASANENVSRQVSVLQLQVQLGEVRRSESSKQSFNQAEESSGQKSWDDEW